MKKIKISNLIILIISFFVFSCFDEKDQEKNKNKNQKEKDSTKSSFNDISSIKKIHNEKKIKLKKSNNLIYTKKAKKNNKKFQFSNLITKNNITYASLISIYCGIRFSKKKIPYPAIGLTSLLLLSKSIYFYININREINWFVDSFKSSYDIFKSRGKGITDMKPNSKCIQKAKNYLKNTTIKTLLLSTQTTYGLYIVQKFNRIYGYPWVNIDKNGEIKYKEEYNETKSLKKQINNLNLLYNDTIGGKNDILLSKKTQSAHGISNPNITRKDFISINHFDQINNSQLKLSIFEYLLNNMECEIEDYNKFRQSKFLFILNHGVHQKPNRKHYMKKMSKEFKYWFPNSEVLLPIVSDFENDSIQSQAHQLVRKINLFKINKSITEIIVVGHSQGCIRSILFSKILNQMKVKHTLICIGGPLLGAEGLIDFENKFNQIFKSQVIRKYTNHLMYSYLYYIYKKEFKYNLNLVIKKIAPYFKDYNPYSLANILNT